MEKTEKRPHPMEVQSSNKEWFKNSSYASSGICVGLWVAIKDQELIDFDNRHVDIFQRINAAQGRDAQFVTIISVLPRRS